MRIDTQPVDNRIWRYNRFNHECKEFRKGGLYWHFTPIYATLNAEHIRLERCIKHTTDREAPMFELISELPSEDKNLPTMIELVFGSLAGDANRKGTRK